MYFLQKSNLKRNLGQVLKDTTPLPPIRHAPYIHSQNGKQTHKLGKTPPGFTSIPSVSVPFEPSGSEGSLSGSADTAGRSDPTERAGRAQGRHWLQVHRPMRQAGAISPTKTSGTDDVTSLGLWALA